MLRKFAARSHKCPGPDDTLDRIVPKIAEGGGRPEAMEKTRYIIRGGVERKRGAVVAEGLASQAEIDLLVAELYEFAHTPGTVGRLPRVVGAWGYRS